MKQKIFNLMSLSAFTMIMVYFTLIIVEDVHQVSFNDEVMQALDMQVQVNDEQYNALVEITDVLDCTEFEPAGGWSFIHKDSNCSEEP